MTCDYLFYHFGHLVPIKNCNEYCNHFCVNEVGFKAFVHMQLCIYNISKLKDGAEIGKQSIINSSPSPDTTHVNN